MKPALLAALALASTGLANPTMLQEGSSGDFVSIPDDPAALERTRKLYPQLFKPTATDGRKTQSPQQKRRVQIEASKQRRRRVREHGKLDGN